MRTTQFEVLLPALKPLFIVTGQAFRSSYFPSPLSVCWCIGAACSHARRPPWIFQPGRPVSRLSLHSCGSQPSRFVRILDISLSSQLSQFVGYVILQSASQQHMVGDSAGIQGLIMATTAGGRSCGSPWTAVVARPGRAGRGAGFSGRPAGAAAAATAVRPAPDGGPGKHSQCCSCCISASCTPFIFCRVQCVVQQADRRGSCRARSAIPT